jgi:hypothetical protein
MDDDCDFLAAQYAQWLTSSISVERVGEHCEVTTPFLDRHNDHIQIFVSRRGDGYWLTDDAESLTDLAVAGVDVSKGPRKDLLKTILSGFGVQRQGDAIVAECDTSSVAQRLHMMLQAVMAVNDLHVLTRQRVAALFADDVREFLNLSGVQFESGRRLAGKSGFMHDIDFTLRATAAQPLRMLQAIAKPTKKNISSYLFMIDDIRSQGADRFKPLALLNDREGNQVEDDIAALEAYEITCAKWSERDSLLPSLAA